MEISKEFFIKMMYMLSRLKPDDISSYVIYNDEPMEINYKDTQIVLQKGSVLCKKDENFPWAEISGKCFTITNKQFFTFIITRYLVTVCVELWKEHLSTDTIIEKELFDKALIGFDDEDMFSISLNIQSFCNDNIHIQNFFTSFNEKEHTELFKTPACLIPLFIINKFQEKTLNNWQFGNEELKELLQIMNISEDVI